MLRGAGAGVIAAAIWAAQEPLDMKVFGVEYSDTEMLAKPLKAPRWAGAVLHFANGAIFGAVYAPLASRMSAPGIATGIAAGMAEHLATWPLVRFLPRVDLWGNHRAFAQAVWRHVLFGAVLGAVEERLR
jgi:hypothetical protein